jgi:hypothetical protein
MSELGGATTQSGILYQNTIAALYLGRLCSGVESPPDRRIVEVRCEAPTKIDDIILTYADDHREFIQAKESLEPRGKLWEQIWRDSAHQITEQGFQPKHDRVILFAGDIRNKHRALRGIIERAESSTCFEEWLARLTQEQQPLFAQIQAILKSLNFGTEEQRTIVRCVRVHQECLDDLEFRAYRELPLCNVRPITLFRLLRDRVGGYASLRKSFHREELLASLQSEHGITFDSPLPSAASNNQDLLSFVPEDRSRLQWFVSSRLKGDCLRAEREAAIAAIMETQIIIPWAWERNSLAGHYPYEETCIHFASKSDGLILIVEGDVSPLCQKEYHAAATRKKPCYIFIKDGYEFEPAAEQFIAEQRKQGSNPIRFRNIQELKSLLGKSLQAECVRAFRHSHGMLISTPTEQARLR